MKLLKSLFTHHHYFSASIVVLAFLLGGFSSFSSSSFASAGEVDIVFEECVSSVCQELIEGNESHVFSSSLEKGQKIKLAIAVLNPQRKNLYSVESWIKFDPRKISISNLSSQDSAFVLEAPGEFNVNNEEGVVMIGRAASGAPVVNTVNLVATFEITAKVNTKGSVLSFIDYRSSDVGKTSVLTIKNMVPKNVLFQKPKDLLFASLASHGAPGQYTIPSSTQQTQHGTTVYGVTNPNNSANQSTTFSQYQTSTSQIPDFIEIPRPQGLRTRTYLNGKIESIWKKGEDKRIAGYYLYYSTTSGRYMHRKDLGKTNVYQFPADFFEKGKRVYFAVQAYDAKGKSSDFSDETYVTVGVEGSESHPFFEQIFPDVTLDENGKAYKTEDGKHISAEEAQSRNDSQYSGNLSTKYPSNNTQSGGSENFLFLLLGLVLSGIGIRKLYT